MDANNFWQDVARYEVADVDGDQKLELIGLEYGYTTLDNGSRDLQARPFLLDGLTGKTAMANKPIGLAHLWTSSSRSLFNAIETTSLRSKAA